MLLRNETGVMVKVIKFNCFIISISSFYTLFHCLVLQLLVENIGYYLYALPIVGSGRAAGVGPHAARVAGSLAPYPPVQDKHHHPDEGEHGRQNARRVLRRHHLQRSRQFR